MFYLFSVLLIECTSVLLFLVSLRHLYLADRRKAIEFFLAFFYGVLLEELDIYFFRTYRYGPGFLLQIGQAPIAIALLWALILYSSMSISDRLGWPEFSRPFLDGLLALLIDIGVDAIAIRLGYWSWTIPLSEGWFGVPAGNLYSWMWVAFAYSFMTRIVRFLGARDRGRYVYQTLVPFASYLFLFIVISVVGIASFHLGFLKEAERLWVFYGHVFFFGLVCLAVFFAGLKRERVRGETVADPLLWSRFLIHLYFLMALFVTGMAFQIPSLALVALSAFAVECWLGRQIRSGDLLQDASR